MQDDSRSMERPEGSTTTGRVGTDERSPRSTSYSRRIVAPSRPNPDRVSNSLPVNATGRVSPEIAIVMPEWTEPIEDIVNHIGNTRNEQVLAGLKNIAIKMSDRHRDWLSDDGQAE